MSIKYYCDNKKCGKQLTLKEVEFPKNVFSNIWLTEVDCLELCIEYRVRPKIIFSDDINKNISFQRHLCEECNSKVLDSATKDTYGQLKRFEEALKFYADTSNYQHGNTSGEIVVEDYGKIARAALEENK